MVTEQSPFITYSDYLTQINLYYYSVPSFVDRVILYDKSITYIIKKNIEILFASRDLPIEHYIKIRNYYIATGFSFFIYKQAYPDIIDYTKEYTVESPYGVLPLEIAFYFSIISPVYNPDNCSFLKSWLSCNVLTCKPEIFKKLEY